MNDRAITFRAPEAEAARLKAYATASGRTQSDILREFIRSLETRRARPARKRQAAAE